MSFGTQDFIYYYAGNGGDTVLEVQFAGNAWLEYKSSNRATITFDFADITASDGDPPHIGNSFPVQINSASTEGNTYTISFTIQFPNCPASVEATYRVP